MSAIARETVTRNFPLWGAQPPGREPYALIAGLRDGDEVFYAPDSHASGSGTWVFTRFRRIKELYALTTKLSSKIRRGSALC